MKDKSVEYKEVGNKYFLEEDFEKAIEMYTKAIECNDKNPIYYANRSACLFAMCRFEEALQDGLKSIEIDDKYIKGYLRASNAYFELNRFEEAIATLDKISDIEKYEELVNLKKKIILKQEELEYNLKNFKSYSRFQSFFKWLSQGGANYSKLELKYFSDDHRGVVSKTKIKKDEIILQIPKGMLITLEMAKESPLGMKMVRADLNLNSPKHSFLTTYLLQERNNPLTKWQNYIDILPKNYDNFPIFFTDEEKKLLEGSPFLNQIQEKISDMTEDYNMIVKEIPEYEEFSFKDFSEIRMAVSSRIFGIKINNKKTDCFAPLADMLNHKRPRQTQWYYSDDHNAFIIESLQDFEKGEQINDSYGKKCNSRFLLNYGFIVENNDGNEFPFTILLEESDPFFSVKKSILQKDSIKKTFRVQEDFSEQPVIDFFSFIRFKVFNEDVNMLLTIFISKENKQEDEESKSGFNKIPPFSIKNELRVLEFIEKIANECLNKYPNTLEEDQKILQDNNSLTNNQRNCVLMRMGEKQILKFYLQFARYCIPLFTLDSKEIKKKIRKDFVNVCPYENYINDTILNLIRKESSKK